MTRDQETKIVMAGFLGWMDYVETVALDDAHRLAILREAESILDSVIGTEMDKNEITNQS